MSEWKNINYEQISQEAYRCQNLWVHVLERLRLDLIPKKRKKFPLKKNDRTSEKYLRESAINYVNIENKDFIKVCEMANVNPMCYIELFNNTLEKTLKIIHAEHKKSIDYSKTFGL